MSNEIATFKVGDRVILQGLVKAKRLNGRHGTVGLPPNSTNDRCAIDLDLPDAMDPNASSNGIAVRGTNLMREPPLPVEAEEGRARVAGGRLVEEQGRPMSFILDNIRFLVGYLFVEGERISFVKC